MKTLLLTPVFLLLFFRSVFSQSEKPQHRTVAESFESNFNSDNFEAIFNAFSSDMQAYLPLPKTKQFLGQIKKDAGQIKKREFVKYKNGSALYKTTFEKMVLGINFSLDNNSKINGFLVEPYTEEKSERNKTKLILPFKDQWNVFWGGDTREDNYHVDYGSQKHAFDLLINDETGKSFKNDGKSNEDYYVFGKELIAPCDGEIVLAVDGIKDNVPKAMNPIYLLGNAVIIKTENNEYLVFAHLKQHSVSVKQGQIIKQGQILGLCGNSGNSSEPHLHFHIQNKEDLSVANGIKCYFDKIMVNGQIKNDYSPIKKDKIQNLK
jgi:hypothetical protein